MSLYQSIGESLKASMKSGDVLTRDTLRLLQSALKNAAIELHKEAAVLSDTEVQEVVKRLVKQRKDSIEQYRAGNRPELAAKEESELSVLTQYVPAQLSREATETLVDVTLQQLGDVSIKDMGRIMGAVMKAAEGKADGGVVREIVALRLQ